MYNVRIEAPIQRLAYPTIIAQKDNHQSMYSFTIDLRNVPMTSCDFAEMLFQHTRHNWQWKMLPQSGHRLFYTFIDNFNDSDASIAFYIKTNWKPDENDFIKVFSEEEEEDPRRFLINPDGEGGHSYP